MAHLHVTRMQSGFIGRWSFILELFNPQTNYMSVHSSERFLTWERSLTETGDNDVKHVRHVFFVLFVAYLSGSFNPFRYRRPRAVYETKWTFRKWEEDALGKKFLYGTCEKRALIKILRHQPSDRFMLTVQIYISIYLMVLSRCIALWFTRKICDSEAIRLPSLTQEESSFYDGLF